MSILDALPLFDFMYIHTYIHPSNATFVSFLTQKRQKLVTKNQKKVRPLLIH